MYPRSSLLSIDNNLKRTSQIRSPGTHASHFGFAQKINSPRSVVRDGKQLINNTAVFGISPPVYTKSTAEQSFSTLNIKPTTVGTISYNNNSTSLSPQLKTGTARISNIGVQAFRQSSVPPHNSNPVIQIVQNQPVHQVVTTPARVQEIVQPIVSMTPNIVTERRVTQTPAPIAVPRKARGARGHYEEIRVNDELSACPWWLWLLFGIVFLLAIVTGLVHLFKSRYWTSESKEEVKKDEIGNNTPSIKPMTTQKPTQIIEKKSKAYPIPVSKPEPKPQPQSSQEQQKSQTKPEDSNNNGKGFVPDESEIQNLPEPTTSNTKGQNLTLQSSTQPPLVKSQPNQNEVNSETVTNITCQTGYFLHKGKCIACPSGSIWNGQKCIRKIKVQQPVETVQSPVQNKQKDEVKQQPRNEINQTASTTENTPAKQVNQNQQIKQQKSKQSQAQKQDDTVPKIQKKSIDDIKRQLNIEDAWSVIKSPELKPQSNFLSASKPSTINEQQSNKTSTATQDLPSYKQDKIDGTKSIPPPDTDSQNTSNSQQSKSKQPQNKKQGQPHRHLKLMF